jgi:hypothetical protein
MIGEYERYNETVDLQMRGRPFKRGRQFSHDDENDLTSDDGSESEIGQYFLMNKGPLLMERI